MKAHRHSPSNFSTGSLSCDTADSCEQVSLVSGQSYTCSCNAGYSLTANDKSCSGEQFNK